MDLLNLYTNQIQYATGFLLFEVILCHGILPVRRQFPLRAAAGYAGVLLLSILYVPLRQQLDSFGWYGVAVMLPLWLAMNFSPIAFILLCYHTNMAGALFRALMAGSAENTLMVLFRYLLFGCFFPGFVQSNPFLYNMLLLIFYSIAFWIFWIRVRSHVSTDESGLYQAPRQMSKWYLAVYLVYIMILGMNMTLFEYAIQPLMHYSDLHFLYRLIQYGIVLVMLVFGTVISIMVYLTYQTLTLRSEKQIISRMMQERQAQYEFSRENIEMINRKAHDIKHQLMALEFASSEARSRQLKETLEAVDFYDSIVKTGSEALDTILTEKSVYCRNRSIRLSCTVNTTHLDRMEIVDLYTLLGNAIDNAIESVEKLSDPDRRTISLVIRDQGQMLFFQIDNYFEGDLRMQDGLPATTKADPRDHGFGIRSIRSIVHRYGGEMMIHADGPVFSLEMLFPIS